MIIIYSIVLHILQYINMHSALIFETIPCVTFYDLCVNKNIFIELAIIEIY